MTPSRMWMASVAVVLAVGSIAACSSDDSPSGAADSGVADTGSDAGDAGDGSTTLKALGETCGRNEDCASKTCFVGGQQSYCSLSCTPANAATVCTAPFTGTCNGQGYCKK